jgi:hypothetical protein
MRPHEKSSSEKIIVAGYDKFGTLDMYVEICDGPQKITIPKQYLEYSLWGKTEIKGS